MFSSSNKQSVKEARRIILRNIEKLGLVNRGGMTSASVVHSTTVCANIVKPQYFSEKNLSSEISYAINNPFSGSKAISVERNFAVNIQNTEELTKLFSKRLKYNVLFVLEGDDLVEQGKNGKDAITEGTIKCNNRNCIKAIFTPTNLYTEVKTIFKNVEVVPLEFKNTTYRPHNRFVTSYINFHGDKEKLIATFIEQLKPVDQNTERKKLSEFNTSLILSLLNFDVMAPDYDGALTELIKNKKAKKDNHPFAIHVTRLPNNFENKCKVLKYNSMLSKFSFLTTAALTVATTITAAYYLGFSRTK